MTGRRSVWWFLAVVGAALVVFAGALSGIALLPVTVTHHSQGAIPDGMALRIDLGPGVQLRVATTATLGGAPRYQSSVTAVYPSAEPVLSGRTVSARCDLPGWLSALGRSCSAELLVVVDQGRPVRLYSAQGAAEADVDPDVFLEESRQE